MTDLIEQRLILAARERPELEAELTAALQEARGERAVRLAGLVGAPTVTFHPWTRERGVDWAQGRLLAGEVADAVVTYPVPPGRWVVSVSSGAGLVALPLDLGEPGGPVDLTCPVDPATVPTGMIYVPGGQVIVPGRGAVSVGPLLWERHEVTIGRYADFLATLDAQARRARVPRLAPDLGAQGHPLWDADGDGFATPSGAARKPVEGISFHDARAFAAAQEDLRLPTRAEWLWAAGGPFAMATPVGAYGNLMAGAAHVDRPVAGRADAMVLQRDRSAFGLFDMAGNLAEYTSTLETWRGETGWIVLGGSYPRPASDALLDHARVVPGWQPLVGVGFRLVRTPAR